MTTIIETQPPPPPHVKDPSNNFLVHDETTGQVYSSAGETYSGPVGGLTNDIILATSDNINVNAEVPNVFIKTGGGDDAIDVSAVNGNNVMDGSTGSNFLTGGSGQDTFFVDDRNASADIWSTVNGFHAGDAATIWGVTAQDFNLSWVDGQGATGFTGLTLHATAPGKSIASITLAGYTSADPSNGRLSVSFGSVDGNNYMYVHGNA
jgi:Ca2+-binding RTX toxin-like protein